MTSSKLQLESGAFVLCTRVYCVVHAFAARVWSCISVFTGVNALKNMCLHEQELADAHGYMCAQNGDNVWGACPRGGAAL